MIISTIILKFTLKITVAFMSARAGVDNHWYCQQGHYRGNHAANIHVGRQVVQFLDNALTEEIIVVVVVSGLQLHECKILHFVLELS